MPESDPVPADPGHDATSSGQPSGSRPGTRPSAPSASHYIPELPSAEELQALLQGKYTVESFLGQGGMGAVYRGLQLPLKRPVAIKILAKRGDGVGDDFAFEGRFKREAYAMAALTHPNIVQVYDCGDAGEHWLFISMELVDGGDLSDAIKAGKCPPEVALMLMPQICDGMQAAHDRGIVHRDIKPGNIFLTADGRPKVADFGLAKKFGVKGTLVTKTGLGMGTPDYAAPEQYEGIPDIDHRADIYALGVMFYQMLTGSLPRGAYKSPSRRVPIDPRLDGVVSRAMEQDRTERYQTVGDMKADVQRIVATGMQSAQPAAAPVTHRGTDPTPARETATSRPTSPAPTRPVSVPPRPQTKAQPPPKKSRAGVVIGMLLGVLAIAAGAFFVLRKPGPGQASPDLSTPTSMAPGSALTTPVDLLALVNTDRDGVSGNWKVLHSGILASPKKETPVQLLAFKQTAPAEYDFEIEFSIRSGSGTIMQVLPVPGGSIQWKMKVEKNHMLCGFGPELDGTALDAAKRTEAVAKVGPLTYGQVYRSLVQVRKGSLRALLDGKELVNWSGDLKRFGNHPQYVFPDPKCLGFACFNTALDLTKAGLRPPGAVHSPR